MTQYDKADLDGEPGMSTERLVQRAVRLDYRAMEGAPKPDSASGEGKSRSTAAAAQIRACPLLHVRTNTPTPDPALVESLRVRRIFPFRSA